MIKNKYIDERFINCETDNPLHTLEEFLIDIIEKFPKAENNSNKIEEVKALNIVNAYCKAHSLAEVSTSNINLSASFSQFRANFNQRLTNLILKETAGDYEKLFKKQAYPLSDDEYQTIQNCINNLRDKINNTKDLVEEHKSRILKKLNEMQTELNKNMSTFDSIIGKSMIVLKTISFGRKEIVTPLMKDAIELTKELNKIETIHSEIPNTDNQIEYVETVLIEEEII